MTQVAHLVASQLAGAGRFVRSPLFPIFMIVFVDVLGFGITMPVVPLYAESEFGASATEITLLTSMYFAIQFFAAPRLGRLSDRVGRRPVLIISQFGTFLALLLSGLAPALGFLYVARLVDGATGGNISVAQAYLSDITNENNRARGMGIIHAAFNTSLLFGPAFGGLLAAEFGPRVPFFIAAVVALITILLSYFLLPESLSIGRQAARKKATPGLQPQALPPVEHRPTGDWAMLRLPSVALIMAVGFGAQFAFFSFQSTWVLWAERVVLAGHNPDFVQRTVGGIFTFMGVFGIATQIWLVGWLARRFGERAMIFGGVLTRGLAYLALGLMSSLAPVMAAIPLISIGGGVGNPALAALVTYVAPRDRQGQVIGLLQSVQNIGRIAGPLLAGVLFEHLHPGAPLLMAALLSVPTLIGAAELWRMPLQRPGGPATP